MTDFLEEKKREINAGLKGLRPLVDEYPRLEAAAAALDGVGDTAAAASTPARGTGASRRGRGGGTRAASGGGSGSGTRRRGRPRGSGTPSQQAPEPLRAPPRISLPQIAPGKGIPPNQP